MKLLAQLIIGLISVLIMAAPAFAAGQSSANFIMRADALNNGVGDMTSANFRLSSSLGDGVGTGTITSVSFKLANGFRQCERPACGAEFTHGGIAQVSWRRAVFDRHQ